jgi:hypothetical protein
MQGAVGVLPDAVKSPHPDLLVGRSAETVSTTQLRCCRGWKISQGAVQAAAGALLARMKPPPPGLLVDRTVETVSRVHSRCC